MKRKRVLPLLTALTAGGLVLLSGCNVDVTNINEEEVPIEVEAEEEDLAEGTVLLHSVWYDADGNKLSDINVAFYEDETLLFSEMTDENGDTEAFSLPSNTTLFCSVTDEDGNPIAETDLAIKLSDRYDTLTIYPARDTEEGSSTLTLAIPTDRTNLRAAFYVTEAGTVSVASLTPYSAEETTEEETEETTEEQSAEEQSAEAQPAAEQSAEEQSAEAQPAEEQSAEAQPAAEQPAEEQSAEAQPAEAQPAEEQSAEAQPAAEQPAEN